MLSVKMDISHWQHWACLKWHVSACYEVPMLVVYYRATVQCPVPHQPLGLFFYILRTGWKMLHVALFFVFFQGCRDLRKKSTAFFLVIRRPPMVGALCTSQQFIKVLDLNSERRLRTLQKLCWKNGWKTDNKFVGFLTIYSTALHFTASVIHKYICKKSLFIWRLKFHSETILSLTHLVQLLLFGIECINGTLKEVLLNLCTFFWIVN